MTPKSVQLVCVASFLAKPGKEEELARVMAALMPFTRREEGCIRYELNICIEDPRRLTMIEKFNDDASFEKHGAEDYLKNFLEKRMPDLVESVRVETYREIAP